MTPKELKALAQVCQKYGISQFEDNGVKITFSLGYSAPRPLTKAQLKKEEGLRQMSEMSDEQLALYSAQAGFDLTEDPKPAEPSK